MSRAKPMNRALLLHAASVLGLGLLLYSMGCDSPAGTGPTTVVRDSAGITIVESAGEVGLDGGGWSVGQEPVLSIGTFQGDSLHQLFQVEGAKRLSDGSIAVSNAGSGEIRFFGSDGGFLGAVGRKGEGPGEFQQPVLVGRLGGDTLVVVDGRLRRASLVHPREGFIESTRLSDDLGGGAFPHGMFEDRTILLGGGFYFSSDDGTELSSGFSRRETSYKSASLEGEMITDFGEFPGSEFFMRVQNEGGGAISMMARLIPFGKHAMQAVGQDFFYYASGDSWEVSAFDPGGTLRRIYRLDRDPTPVGSEDVEARVREEVEASSDPSQAPEIRSRYEEMPVPDFMPAFAGMHVDADGFLWVERYKAPGDETPIFDILAPDGALVGRAQLPPGSEILEVGTDYILALYRDELDIEYVKLLALQRPFA